MFRAWSIAHFAAFATLTLAISGCGQRQEDTNDDKNAKIGHTHGDKGHKQKDHDGHGSKEPEQRAGDEERKVLFTPGGKYTQADIDANGDQQAWEKLKGLMARHDAKPKPGDKTCPISETKANPRFTWIVGGKTYEFCCSPCVVEFVSRAKEHPEAIKEPESYRQK